MEPQLLASPRTLVHDVLRRVTSLTKLPATLSQVIVLAQSPLTTAPELQAAVAGDAVLMARVLGVVNSAFHGIRSRVFTVEQATTQLGLAAVRSIAVAACVGQVFRTTSSVRGSVAAELWKHSVAVALTARELAALHGVAGEEPFLAGLVHDVGLLVQHQDSPEKLEQVCRLARSEQRPFVEVERTVLGVDHQLLGQGLLQAWRLPWSCQLVAAHHHHPLECPLSSRRAVGWVHVADTLCCATRHGFNLTAARQQVCPARLVALGMEPSHVDRVRAGLDSIVLAAAGLAS